VRGLDYYTHTAFEFQSGALGGAQNTIGGGGRYDGLVESLGGAPTPGIGYGTGIERVLATCDAEGVFDAPASGVDVFLIDTTGGDHARDQAFALRRAGIGADRAFGGGSYKSQEKQARRSGARILCTIRPDDLADGLVSVRSLVPADDGGDVGDGPDRVALTDLVAVLQRRLDPSRPSSKEPS
ncbi:MAG TPA: hypothetical protein VIJ47_13330, partial [Acidimicrobiales bacterium]